MPKATRDIQAEKILVREKWQLVHANIKVDDAMKAFLTEGLDVCGQSVAFAAFDLVRQVLNPKGYVRRDHTGELRNIGAVVRDGDSSWSEKGKSIHTKWDFNDVWSSYRTKHPFWHKEEKYTELLQSTVANFCELSNLNPVLRNQRAQYKDTQIGDVESRFSLPVLDSTSKYLSEEVFESLPISLPPGAAAARPVTRWQTHNSSLQGIAMEALYANGMANDYKQLEDSNCKLEPYWRFAMRVNKWRQHRASAPAPVQQIVDDDAQNDISEHALSEGSAEEQGGSMPVEALLNEHDSFDESRAQGNGPFNSGTAMKLTTSSRRKDLTFELLIACRGDKARLQDARVLDLTRFARDNNVRTSNNQKISGNKSQFVDGVYNFLADKDDDYIRSLILPQPMRRVAQQHARVQQHSSSVDYSDDDEEVESDTHSGENSDRDQNDDDDEPDDTRVRGSTSQMQRAYGYWVKHRTCNHLDKPDLVLKLGYFCEETGLFKQRSVIAEIDGHDKTVRPTYASNVDSIKLALKLMTSTSAQAVLQPETYHIRSNLSSYLRNEIVQSVLAVTNVHLPDFQEFLEGLHNQSKDYSELVTFQNAIHWVHHLFLAHVKIAFLIHMREMHNIDMLCEDTRNKRMQDHFFFINFSGSHLPTELVFEHNCPVAARLWLQERLMFLTRVKIKCNGGNQSKWKFAPVVNASSEHAQMKTWKAGVRSMQVPAFPYEETSMMPIACATTQRVDMRKLCEIVVQAATEAACAYIDARQMPGNVGKREFPDKCFLLRRHQLQRDTWWSALRTPAAVPEHDRLEYNWGFEDPVRKRSYRDATESQHWDQIDLRMHLFDEAMAKTSWKAAADGMWYVQDYTDFMSMLQQLDMPKDTSTDMCSVDAVFGLPGAVQGNTLPRHTHVNDCACHRYSVLSWFFDCRDAGACRYAWEDYVLEYFGAYTTAATSEFSKFELLQTLPKPHFKYFMNPWFQIVLFMEQNFRNAIAPMHYQLFEMRGTERVGQLQKKAKMLYNRQRKMLNNRACFDGLQLGSANGSSLLSFRRFHAASNANMTLRERIMSQMHDELPLLDPFLSKYVAQFRIPDAELFLRMIRCPNVLALRELAVQHRHVLAGPGAANGAAKAAPKPSALEQTLHFFPIAVQTEILYMLQFVERDDSVYTDTVAIHESKLMLVPQDLLRRWIRETLQVAGRVQSLQSPLQMKCYMFTMPELSGGGVGAFHSFKRLFYTTEAMMNYGSKRSVVFVLLQMRLLLLQLQHAQTTRSNPLAELLAPVQAEIFGEDGMLVDVDCSYSMKVWPDENEVQWTPGTCLQGWPRRDLNEFTLPFKPVFVDATVVNTGAQLCTDAPSAFDAVSQQTNVFGHSSPAQCVFVRQGMDTMHGETYEMTQLERTKWLLLLYARPQPLQFVAEDNTHVTQCTQERTDSIVARLNITRATDGLACEIVDDEHAPLFFEKVQHACAAGKAFPAYVQEIISTVPHRKLIYVPKVFAARLRREQSCLHTAIFVYGNCSWRMVCVGTRAWAWKRLLVKSIFFDAVAKIMTRSSVQLALYQPLRQCSLSDRKQLTEQYDAIVRGHRRSSPVFGDLEFKLELLRRNMAPKAVQLLFTTHETRRRCARIETHDTDFTHKKIGNMMRQLQLAMHCNEHWALMKPLPSCRYMLVDDRILAKHLSQQDMEQAPELVLEDVLLYRSYLYLLHQNHTMVVRFRDKTYLKFPQNYAVIRAGDRFITGKMTFYEQKHIYATFFDTRTYSCARPKLQRKADSPEMMKVIRDCTGVHSNMPSTFPSTNALARDCHSWIWLREEKVTMTKSLSPLLFEALTCGKHTLKLQDQKHMYTLPDFFSLQEDKQAALQHLSVEDDTLLSWSEDVTKWTSQAADNWVSLRKTTKFLACDGKVLQDKDANISHTLLQPLLRTIRSGLLQSTSIDKSEEHDQALQIARGAAW